MRMQAEAGQQGPSSENVSAALSKMVAELAGQDKSDEHHRAPAACEPGLPSA